MLVFQACFILTKKRYVYYLKSYVCYQKNNPLLKAGYLYCYVVILICYPRRNYGFHTWKSLLFSRTGT